MSEPSPLAWLRAGSFTAALLAKRPIFWHCNHLTEALTQKFEALSCLAPKYRQLKSTAWCVLLLCAQLCSSLDTKCFKVQTLSLHVFIYLYFYCRHVLSPSQFYYSPHAEAASHCFTASSQTVGCISQTCTHMHRSQPCMSLCDPVQVVSGPQIPHHPTHCCALHMEHICIQISL